jgi:hypothetical protein
VKELEKSDGGKGDETIPTLLKDEKYALNCTFKPI